MGNARDREPADLHRPRLCLHARDGLIDTVTWRVRLQDYFPVARFGASFYIRTRERFSMEPCTAIATTIDEL